MSNTDFPDVDPPAGGEPSPFGTADLTRTPLARNPYAPDPNDHTLDGGQVLYHMAFGAKPEDFHPNLQPTARAYGPLFQPRPKLGPGLLGSLDDVRSAIASQPSDAADGAIPALSVSTPLGLDTSLPDLHIPSRGAPTGPLGLQDVDGLPIQPGSRAIPRFDGLVADNVSSFFKELGDQNIPIRITGGFRPSGTQTHYTNNKYGGAKAGNSLHEAGLAFDVNWAQLDKAQQAMALQTAKRLGFKWGGDFKKSDAIHFYTDPFANLSDRQAYIRSLQGR